MDAEGLGRKLLLTPPLLATPGKPLASHEMLTLQALSSSLNPGTAKRGCLGQGKPLGDLWQPVPQNSRIP